MNKRTTVDIDTIRQLAISEKAAFPSINKEAVIMLIRKLLIVLLFSPLIFTVFSDVIIFQTDFNELPDDWFASAGWEFGSQGAETHSWPADLWSEIMFTGNGPPELIYSVPDGADSIIVTIPYYLYASVMQESIDFEIRMGGSNSGWDELWSKFVSGEVTFSETGTIEVSPDWIIGGEWIGIKFDVLAGFGSGGSLIWKIQGLTITAIGDSLTLNQSTWALIKSASEWE